MSAVAATATDALEPWSLPGIAPDEESLLRRAADVDAFPALSDISPDSLQAFASRHGVELATAVLFDRVVRSNVHGQFIRHIESLRLGWKQKSPGRLKATVMIAPGAFYVEYPKIGADGRLMRPVTDAFRCHTELIRSVSVSGLTENARRINEALRDQTGPVILASFSKGGADVKAAMARPDAREAFANVAAWVDFCGITHGSPLPAQYLATPWRYAFAHFFFWLRGHDRQFLRDMAPRAGGPLDGPIQLPPTLSRDRVIHVSAFPLLRHTSTRLIRRHYRRLAPLGPNDGCTMLGNLPSLPGVIYPMWGIDHYLRPAWDIQSLAAAILLYLGESCGLLD